MRDDGVGNVLVAPQGTSAALHVADAADAVDDALVVAVAGLELGEQFGIRGTRRFAVKVFAVAYVNGGRGVVVGHMPVLNVDTWRTVGRSRHDVVAVKAQVAQVLVERAVPVLLSGAAAQSQVPFSHGVSPVALRAEQVGQGILPGTDNHAGVAGCNVGAVAAKGVLPREQAVARGGTGGSHGVGVGKSYAFAGQAVGVGRADSLGAVAREVAVAQVVGNQKNDVGPFLCGGCRGQQQAASAADEVSFHVCQVFFRNFR